MGGVKPPPPLGAAHLGATVGTVDPEKSGYVIFGKFFLFLWKWSADCKKKFARKFFWSGGIHARARVFVKNPTPNCDLGGPKSPKPLLDLQIEASVLSKYINDVFLHT